MSVTARAMRSCTVVLSRLPGQATLANVDVGNKLHVALGARVYELSVRVKVTDLRHRWQAPFV
jgi:hypothetical protein